MSINKQSFLSRIKQGVVNTGGSILSTPSRLRSKSRGNKYIPQLIRKYGITTSSHGSNLNAITKHVSSLLDKGKASDVRNYLKQQAKGIKGTNIIKIEKQ